MVVDQVMNLSLGGMMILSQFPIAPGEELQLTLRGHRRRRVALSADVVWAEPSKELPGIEAGVRFLAQSIETAQQLEELMIEVLATPRGRRAGVRFTVSLEAWWRGQKPEQTAPVELTDLSLTGAMLTGERVPEYGERGLLALDLGDGVIAVPAVVAWRDVHRTPCASGLTFDRGQQASEFVAKVVRATLFHARSPVL